jgi:hypothetical protein
VRRGQHRGLALAFIGGGRERGGACGRGGEGH